MSFLRPTGTQWRTPEYGRSVIVSTSRGVTRVQAWPRKRGPAKTEAEATRRMVFAVYQGLIKRMHPREYEAERDAIKAHNQANKGQRGSAAIRLRDWITQRLYGRGAAFTTPEGIIFYPPAIHRDASHILDHVAADPGQLIQHAASEWGAIPAGAPGARLTAGSTGQPNHWL